MNKDLHCRKNVHSTRYLEMQKFRLSIIVEFFHDL